MNIHRTNTDATRRARSVRHFAGAIAALGCFGALHACGEPPPPPTDEAMVADEMQEGAYPAAAFAVANVGFMTPEAVLHDEPGDVYLVSNINGDPFGKDGNGFISRVAPDGSVIELRWIDGEAEGVTLHAPKGMAIAGNYLYVTDIDVVRVFDRETGAPVEEILVEGATFLNDITAGPDGTVYVSDSGFAPGFEPSGTDAVYAVRNGEVVQLVAGVDLAGPNGLVVDGDEVVMVPFGANEVRRIPTAGGEAVVGIALPAGQLDGVVRLEDGSLLVSSWAGEAVYRISAAGEVTTIAEGVTAPAAIGFDARRQRVLIPLFMDDRIEVRTLPAGE